jgi:signal transduction histidine kinase
MEVFPFKIIKKNKLAEILPKAMKLFLFILSTIFLSFCITKTSAQARISDSFYNDLWPEVRPVNKNALTDKEIITLLSNSNDDQFHRFNKDIMPFFLLAKQKMLSSNKSDRVKFANAIGDFYVDRGDYTTSIYYYQKVIEYAGDDTAYNKEVSEASATLAPLYSYKIMPDLAINSLHRALDKGDQHDSIFMCRIYNGYEAIYRNLGLYEQSIEYSKKYLDEMPQRYDWYEDYLITIFDIAEMYNALYRDTRLKQYADSTKNLIRQTMEKKKDDSESWYARCYFYLGELDYYDNKYKTAGQLYDSALLPKYIDNSVRAPNTKTHCRLERAICLIKLGNPDGIKILDTLQLKDRDFFALLEKNRALYEDATAKGNWKNALAYYERYIAATDSLDIINTRGRIFEANQKYSVVKKEATINSLEKDKLLQEKKETKIKVIVAIIVLSLIIAILLLVWYYKQLQLRKEKEKEKLADDLTKAEMKMINERSEQQLRQQILIKEQREKISKNIHDEINSGLAALRFYITDLKASATETKTKDVLAKVEEEAGHLYLQARDFMNNLNADKPIANYNILSLLENLAARFNDESILHIENKIDEAGIEKNFTAKQHYEMYSVIKEAMTNIIKHADATKVTTSITFNNDRCEFSIADNGKGFNRQQIKEGLGLKSLESRIVNELQGEFKINSTVKGTTISGSFPVLA